MLSFLPTGLRDFLLRPFPWETGSSLFLISRPEVIAYYILLLAVAAGIAYSLKINLRKAAPALGFLAVASIGYALVLANLGTIYRERDQLLIVMFAFAGVGVHWVRRRMAASIKYDIPSHNVTGTSNGRESRVDPEGV